MSSLFLFVCLTCRNTCVSYFLMGSSGWLMVRRPHSFPASSFFLHPPIPAQLRLHLSLAKEAPTPADPLPREKNQRTEAGKGDSIEGREMSEEDEAAGKDE